MHSWQCISSIFPSQPLSVELPYCHTLGVNQQHHEHIWQAPQSLLKGPEKVLLMGRSTHVG